MIPLRDYSVFAMLDNLVTQNIHDFVAERNNYVKRNKAKNTIFIKTYHTHKKRCKS